MSDDTTYDPENPLVAKSPNTLQYGSNVGAPIIELPDVSGWKNKNIARTNHYFETKYEELRAEYEQLMQSYQWNAIIFAARFNFEPIQGKTYYLYEEEDGSYSLTLIHPSEWSKLGFIGAFALNADGRWIKQD